MKFNRIAHCGLEKIYNALVETEGKYVFGTNLPYFLSHLSISLDLSEVSDLELMHLYKVATTVRVKNSYVKNMFLNPAEKNIVEPLIAIRNAISTDEDISDAGLDMNNILPIGVCYNDCLVTFSGSALTLILTSNVSKFFIDPSTNALYKALPSDIDAMVLKAFMTNFYEAFYDKLQHHDLLTDFMMQKKYYEMCDGICTISHINTPVGPVNFIDNQSDVMLHQINEIHKAKASGEINQDTDIVYYLTLNTTIATFMQLLKETDMVIDHQDFKILLDDVEVNCAVSKSVLDKYQTRLLSAISDMNDFKISISESEDKLLMRYCMILHGQKVKYNIRISVNEINVLTEMASVPEGSNQHNKELISVLENINKIVNMLKL